MLKFILFLRKRTDSQQGFIFPYFLFLTAVTFLIVSSNLAIYQNNLSLAKYHKEQLKIETLFQMGTRQFVREEINDLNPPDRVTYSYPHGTVLIQYSISGKSLVVDYLVTSEKGAKYRTKKHFDLKIFKLMCIIITFNAHAKERIDGL